MSQVADTIIKQLAGGYSKLTAMTGAKNFVTSGRSISFRIPRAKDHRNFCQITLEPDDTYTMVFKCIRLLGGVDLETKMTGLYADQLREHFESETGLFLSL